jgi:hypothetical protein
MFVVAGVIQIAKVEVLGKVMVPFSAHADLSTLVW